MYWLLLLITIPYLYILLRVYKNLRGIKSFTPDGTPELFISVVVACRNEEASLPLLLGDISSQDYPSALFEVIVADDHSPDRSYDIASGFTGIQNLRVCRNRGRGKKAAIRTAVSEARGNLIVAVDADSRMNPGWLKTIAAFHEKEGSDMIICPVVLEAEGRGFFTGFQELEFLGLQAVTAGSAQAGDPLMCNGANLFFTKKSFEKHAFSLHDELASGDDIFLLHRMKADGSSRISWLESDDARVRTNALSSAAGFLRQRTRWISKAGSYSDFSTKFTALATLAVVILQAATFIAAFAGNSYLLLYISLFLIKSLADYPVLRNRAVRYGKKSVLKWFIPSQLIYPFYVIAVAGCAFAGSGNRRSPDNAASVSSPYRKET
jgi:glycosyltransferase involved in cell wall biosynthesis